MIPSTSPTKPHPQTPRIAPGDRRELGVINWLLFKVLSKAGGVEEAKLFSTLGRNRRLFKAWLVFSGALMPGGRLARRETEIAILRVAHLRDSTYERQHHEYLGRKARLSDAEIHETTKARNRSMWSQRDFILLKATDELLANDDVTDSTWTELSDVLTQAEIIELCLLVGQYRGLATTIHTLRIQPDR